LQELPSVVGEQASFILKKQNIELASNTKKAQVTSADDPV